MWILKLRALRQERQGLEAVGRVPPQLPGQMKQKRATTCAASGEGLGVRELRVEDTLEKKLRRERILLRSEFQSAEGKLWTTGDLGQ